MLLIDDSDNYCLYSDSERDEFLFCLFQHFCLGGKICQYEDNVDPYLDVTKQVYKDLIRSASAVSSCTPAVRFTVSSCYRFWAIILEIFIKISCVMHIL